MTTTNGSRASLRFGSVFAICFGLFFAATVLWSLATPLFAAPDEPAHMIKAAAVERGELVGRLIAPDKATAVVYVPQFFASIQTIPTCFHTLPTVPASCAPSPVEATTKTPAIDYVARYPPLYYLIVGLPTLLGIGDWVLYLMRILSAALVSVFLALSTTVAYVYARQRVMLIGTLVACTPMVLFLGGVVNPSSLEVAAAIATATAGLVLVLDHLAAPPRGLIVTLFVSAGVYELVRSLSPFWLALSALLLLALCRRGELVDTLRRRSVQVGLVVVALFGAVALAWTFKEHSYLVYTPSAKPLSRSVGELTILETSFSKNDIYVPDMIGIFGWFDTYAPTFTYIAWYFMLGTLAVVATLYARARAIVLIALVGIAILVVPVLISSSQARAHGYVWQGRDTLPLAICLPLLCAGLLGRSSAAGIARRLAPAMCVLAGLAQFGAFYEALRRYAVGTAGPDFSFVLHSLWHPPVPILLLLLLEAALASFGLFLLAHAVHSTQRAASRQGEAERAAEADDRLPEPELT